MHNVRFVSKISGKIEFENVGKSIATLAYADWRDSTRLDLTANSGFYLISKEAIFIQ